MRRLQAIFGGDLIGGFIVLAVCLCCNEVGNWGFQYIFFLLLV